MIATSREAADIPTRTAEPAALHPAEGLTEPIPLCEVNGDPGRDDLQAALAAAQDLLESGATSQAVAILRALPERARNRREAVRLTIAAGELDPEFQHLVQQADRQRDARDWPAAEYSYWRALRLYPLHHGYIVQYGHCLKEQGKAAEAEVEYRTALALGAPAEDLRAHIVHVYTTLCGGSTPFPRPPRTASNPAALPLDEAPIRADVEALFVLMLQRLPNNLSETLPMLRMAATRHDVVRLLVEHAEFPRVNRELMVLLAQAA